MAAAELNFEVHNYMEDIVFDLIQQKLQSDPDFDFCPRCVLDIGALVLNIIKPQYIKVATKFADLDHAAANELEQLVDQAAEKVRANPYHGLNGESFELVNLSETMVQRVLADVLEEQGEKFQINDDLIPVAAALVLNQTKPRYAVTVRGRAYQRTAELDHQFAPGMMAAVYNVLNQMKELK